MACDMVERNESLVAISAKEVKNATAEKREGHFSEEGQCESI